MRISDWSSDVCSSDLTAGVSGKRRRGCAAGRRTSSRRRSGRRKPGRGRAGRPGCDRAAPPRSRQPAEADERPVGAQGILSAEDAGEGKECVHTGRTRGSAETKKKISNKAKKNK